MKKKLLFRVFGILVILLSVFILSSCKDLFEESEYELTYTVNGEGHIECVYESGTLIKQSEKVELSAIPTPGTESVFDHWTIDGETNTSTKILVEMLKEHNVIAYFKTIEYIPIANVVDGISTNVKANVVATFNKGYLIKDSSGYALVYLGVSTALEVGDIVTISGKAKVTNGFVTFSSGITTSKVGYEKINDELVEYTGIDIQKYINNNVNCKYVSLNGQVYADGSTYYINVDNSTYKLNLYFPDASLYRLSNASGNKAKVSGYLWTSVDASKVNFIITGIKYEGDGPIVIENAIKAYFDSTWKDVMISVNGGDYKSMTKQDGYFEYPYGSKINYVSFKSGTKETMNFDIDSEKLCFVLSDQKFNSYYSGYFTKYSDLYNEVVRINTLSMNDLHGYISQEGSKGGISNASYIVNKVRQEDSLDNTLLIANGDMFQGTALSNLTRGESVVNLMNAMGFDCMGIGNHEFDWGLDEVLRLFDGDKTNGEANFPLINSNITYTSTGKVVSGDNVLESVIINKNGIKIGVVSCIGPLKSSILATKTGDYNFESVTASAIALCKNLRDNGANIVIVNIHDGESAGILKYSNNITLANATYKNRPLVDAIINGHTHTNQTAHYERNGADIPMMQASSNCYYVGNIDLYYDKVTGQVIYSTVNTYNVNSTAGSNYDSSVQSIYNTEYNKVKTEIEETYCKAGETVSSKSMLFSWAGNVMCAAVGADISFANEGGLRSNGNIERGKDIKLENLYMICPFDNEIVLCEVKGSYILSYINSSFCYYGLKDGFSVNDIVSTKTYKVAVIDYVYYGTYFMTNSNGVNTKVIYREALIADLKLRTTFSASTDTKAVVGNLYNK